MSEAEVKFTFELVEQDGNLQFFDRNDPPCPVSFYDLLVPFAARHDIGIREGLYRFQVTHLGFKVLELPKLYDPEQRRQLAALVKPWALAIC